MIRNSIKVKRLGLISFAQGFKIQRQHVEKILQDRKTEHGHQTLLFLEHRPVYTIGIRSKSYTQDEAKKLRDLGADFVKTNRGGLITFHGPGQLVAYPILDLNRFRLKNDDENSNRNLSLGGVKWYVAQLEGILLETCYNAGLKGVKAPGYPLTGIFTSQNKKIASIGIHANDAVTSHGIALNCDMDLKWFDHIVPCGLENIEMTSLSNELKRSVTVAEAETLFLDAFRANLNCYLT